ncbi:hypothetical protein LIPSTDRAFT_336485 [Lipomyces starkeyi NRRL Y-11557]|uniref:Uncharacterized protein n=1 Tax=Lipomyces starkeyi NRRL Y-11557 TaxID=675824 RepID=A0A1E3Q8P1_LIPST|nr:hypothetical protein LIPSTDRAFT_336485 [Lipomyces starkeyi NRRL Y-11557]
MGVVIIFPLDQILVDTSAFSISNDAINFVKVFLKFRRRELRRVGWRVAMISLDARDINNRVKTSTRGTDDLDIVRPIHAKHTIRAMVRVRKCGLLGRAGTDENKVTGGELRSLSTATVRVLLLADLTLVHRVFGTDPETLKFLGERRRGGNVTKRRPI